MQTIITLVMGVEYYFGHSTHDLCYQSEPRHVPGLLCSCDRPLVATPVCCSVVTPRKRLQVTDDRIGDHNNQGQHPCGSNHPIGMRTGLPYPWLQGVTDGAIALNCYGNQAKSGDAHGYACWKTKQKSKQVKYCVLAILYLMPSFVALYKHLLLLSAKKEFGPIIKK